MPATSKRQFRAMQAAAHGKSTLGIPARVGKEFAGATKNPKELPEKAQAGKTNIGLAMFKAMQRKSKK